MVETGVEGIVLIGLRGELHGAGVDSRAEGLEVGSGGDGSSVVVGISRWVDLEEDLASARCIGDLELQKEIEVGTLFTSRGRHSQSRDLSSRDLASWRQWADV